MNLTFDKVTKMEKDILFRLLEYSLYEESKYDGNEMNQEGIFNYPDFDDYFTNTEKEAYLIKENNQLLGFIMLNHKSNIHSIVEFMIIPKYRKNKIGKTSVIFFFDKYKGTWKISPSLGSKEAYSFWKNVIEELTHSNYEYKNNTFIFKM